uniref:phosphatase PAP2 family protein n=1 Tax=Mycobacterium sp. TaxID=1785 RepID=UPI002615F043
RMLPGFVDTMAQDAGAGWWSTDASAPRGVGSFTNQFAAMPSLHVGWALAVAIGLITATRSRWRWAWLAHPIITLFVVVATGNHYWLDALAAGGLLALVFAVMPRPVIADRERQPAGLRGAGPPG